MGHRRKELRKEFYTFHSLYKNFRQSEQTLLHTQKRQGNERERREEKAKGDC